MTELEDFKQFLIKNKYKNILQHLMLDQCTDDNNVLCLTLIKIKKSQRRKGYGDAVIDDIILFADKNNVRIKLRMSSVYGTNISALTEFYKKHGFVLIKNNEMIYYPNKQY
jgi:ribosomal protein S18 acetylase RimI-like enzyme